MKRQSSDTESKTEAAWLALLRTAKPCQKFAQVRSLSQMTASLSRRAIARRHPNLPEAQLRGLFVFYQYGEDLAERLRQYERNSGRGRS